MDMMVELMCLCFDVYFVYWGGVDVVLGGGIDIYDVFLFEFDESCLGLFF